MTCTRGATVAPVLEEEGTVVELVLEAVVVLVGAGCCGGGTGGSFGVAVGTSGE